MQRRERFEHEHKLDVARKNANAVKLAVDDAPDNCTYHVRQIFLAHARCCYCGWTDNSYTFQVKHCISEHLQIFTLYFSCCGFPSPQGAIFSVFSKPTVTKTGILAQMSLFVFDFPETLRLHTSSSILHSAGIHSCGFPISQISSTLTFCWFFGSCRAVANHR